MERMKSTAFRCGLHILHLLSDLLGDDWLSRRGRTGLLRTFRARLGPGSAFHGHTYFTAPSRLRTGRNCFVNRNCYLDLGGGIVLGDDVVLGHGATIITTEHRMDDPRRRAGSSTFRSVTIGDGAWLGANATVLPGVHIGRGAVVAAGAVVTADVEENVVVAGVPARVMRHLPTDGQGGDGVATQPAADPAAMVSGGRPGRASVI